MKAHEINQLQRIYFNQGKTLSIQSRKNALILLKTSFKQYEKALYEALKADLNKSETESFLTEIGIIFQEINYAIKHIGHWSKKKIVSTSIAYFPAKSFIAQEPYGIALILSPWNYPVQLSMSPLIGAIAAGNCVMMKLSKSSAQVSEVLSKMINSTFPAEYIHCLSNEENPYDEILAEKYDNIFFTGSQRVGKVVMQAAAQYLTPVTLELGGKSPCIVDSDTDIPLAAKRIAWGKFINSGQTCVAPDYVLAHKKVKNNLIDQLNKAVTELYGNNPLHNFDYCKIINTEHYQRLFSLIHGENVAFGGVGDKDQCKIAPTVLDDVTYDSKIMQDEIFGPILPIIEYEDIDHVIADLKKRAHPLALYLFTNNKAIEKKVLENVIFGGGCINDTIIHVGSHSLPFGGVGESGMGSYHGKKSFEVFSHSKSIVKKANWLDIKIRYAPYSQKALNLAKKILK